MKIGFIGLGMMGAGMASNLQKAGHDLVVNDLTRQAASKHLNAGATWADSPRAVAEACDIVFTSLPTPADVQHVGTGERRLDRGLPARLRLVRPFNKCRRRRALAACARSLSRAWISSTRRSAAVRKAPTAAGSRSGSAATRRSTTNTMPSWPRWVIRPPISARSVPDRSPSWCTMHPPPR